jgi:hypothetical protein
MTLPRQEKQIKDIVKVIKAEYPNYGYTFYYNKSNDVICRLHNNYLFENKEGLEAFKASLTKNGIKLSDLTFEIHPSKPRHPSESIKELISQGKLNNQDFSHHYQ